MYEISHTTITMQENKSDEIIQSQLHSPFMDYIFSIHGKLA